MSKPTFSDDSLRVDQLRPDAMRPRMIAGYSLPRPLLKDLLRDPGIAQVAAFQWARRSRTYRQAFEKAAPLISVCVATYNRGRLVEERAVASILSQSYKNLELIVVGDACTDDTAARMSRISDPRLRFVNLAERGRYPEDPLARYMVAGTKPMNHGLSLARGDWITHLDDDDEHAPDRLERLLAFAQAERADLVWHPFEWELEQGWQVNEARSFYWGHVTTSSVLYHSWFKRVRWDIEAWRVRTPGDWHRFRRMKYHGLKTRRFPEVLLKHYRERNQKPAA